MASSTAAWNKHKKWCRLVILLHEGGEKIVKDILVHIGVDITDGAKIYKILKDEETKIKKKPLYLKQLLLPPGGVVDTTKLDFSALCYIIEVLDKQKKFPLIGQLKNRRNDFFHMSDEDKDMTEQQFNKYWNEVSKLLKDFGYDVNMLTGLKTEYQLSEDHKKRLDHIQGRVEE